MLQFHLHYSPVSSQVPHCHMRRMYLQVNNTWTQQRVNTQQHPCFNVRYMGEPDLSASQLVSFLHLFSVRFSGIKWQGVYRPEALLDTQPTASKQ